MRACGCFMVPAHATAVSPCLVTEAIGQLAAWIAMSDAKFQRRPVAALAGEVRIVRAVAPGAVVDLTVDVDECRRDAIAYHGTAQVGGDLVVELNQCVGPMLAMEEFDTPAQVRREFEVLCGDGRSGRMDWDDAIPPSSRSIIEHQPGRCLRANIEIPSEAPLFADHFPRKPVYPATLLLDAQIRLAIELATDVVDPAAHESLRPTRVRGVKVRSFVSPGQIVEMAAEIVSAAPPGVELSLIASSAGRRIATARLSVGQWER